MANTLADLVVRMSADVGSLQRDLGRALGEGRKFASAMRNTLIGGLSVAGFTAFIKGTVDAADRLNDLRTRTGLTGQQLLVMEGAAVRSGAELETVSDVASKLSKRLEDARQGTGDAANAFAAMGIKVTDANGSLKNQDAILREVGARFRTYEDGADKATLATAALGKGGDRLIPFAEALEETEERFKRLGITIDEDFITKADEFNDSVEDMKSVTALLGRGIAAELLPYLLQSSQALIEFLKNQELVTIAVTAVVGPLKIMATGFLTAGTAIAAAGRWAVGFSLALARIGQMDLSGAFDELSIAATESMKIIDAGARVVSAFWDEQERRGKGGWWGDEQRGRAPRMPDLQKAKAAAEALEKLMDARSKHALEADKEMTEKRMALNDRMYSENLVSERDYWMKRSQIQRDGLEAEFRTLDEQIDRQRRTLSKKAPGSKEFYESQRELEETLAKRAKLQRDADHAAVIGSFDSANAMQRYVDSITAVNAELEELRGNTEKALALRQEMSNRDLRRKFMTEGDQGALDLLNQLERAQRAQASFNQTREEQERISARLQIQEERIQNTLRTGAISEIEALRRTGDARKAAADDLERFVTNLERIANDNPAMKNLQLQAEQARASLERLHSESNLLSDKFNQIGESSLADFLTDIASGTKSLKEAFIDLSNTFVREVNKMAAQDISKRIFGGIGGGSGGGFGDIMAKLFSGTLSLLGGGSGLANVTDAMRSDLWSGSYDVGSDFVPRTGLAVVHRGERIWTAAENRRGVGGGREMKVVNNFTINGPTDRRSQEQVAAAASRGLLRGRRVS